MTNDPDVQEAVQDEVESPRSGRRGTLMSEEGGVSAVESKSLVSDKQQAAVDKPPGSPGKVLS